MRRSWSTAIRKRFRPTMTRRDRLYFEPLTAEDVLEILHVEQQNGKLKGVIVQFGGQTPLNLAKALEDAGIPILGTSPDAIDLAEDRERFAALINKLKLKQPENGIARSREEAIAVAETIGYPVLMRPSYVLGGRAMEIVDTQAQLENYIETAVRVSGDSPVLIDRYLRDAVEVDVDCVADGDDVVVAGIAAYRGSRRPFGRQCLHPAALQSARRNHRRNPPPGRGAGASR
jgi:carbamoyl-phosphate synthase large subunit